MGAAREKTEADFDLERFIEMFDEALTSKDERVVNALRSLMMMVILTKPEGRNQVGDRNSGPLRQLYDDLHHLNRRMHSMEDNIRRVEEYQRKDYDKKWPRQDVWNATTYGQAKMEEFANLANYDIQALTKKINKP